MRMLRLGLVSITEAAQIAMVSRQRVRMWCKNAHIDPVKAREAAMAKLLKQLDRDDAD